MRPLNPMGQVYEDFKILIFETAFRNKTFKTILQEVLMISMSYGPEAKVMGVVSEIYESGEVLHHLFLK